MRTIKFFNVIVITTFIGVLASLAYINQQITQQNIHLNAKLSHMESQMTVMKRDSENLKRQINKIEENIRPEVRNLQAGLSVH